MQSPVKVSQVDGDIKGFDLMVYVYSMVVLSAWQAESPSFDPQHLVLKVLRWKVVWKPLA